MGFIHCNLRESPNQDHRSAVTFYFWLINFDKFSKNEVYGNGNDGPRDSPRVPMTISSMSVQSSKQIEEINKKFGARVVAGDSVQKFNGLMETVSNFVNIYCSARMY
jgi:hypothetical protein